MFQEGLPLPDQTTGYAWCDLFLLCCSAAPHVLQKVLVILGLVGRTHPMAYVKSVPFIEGLLIYIYISTYAQLLNSRVYPLLFDLATENG